MARRPSRRIWPMAQCPSTAGVAAPPPTAPRSTSSTCRAPAAGSSERQHVAGEHDVKCRRNPGGEPGRGARKGKSDDDPQDRTRHVKTAEPEQRAAAAWSAQVAEHHHGEDRDLRAEQEWVREIAALEGVERRQPGLRRPALHRLAGDAQREEERQEPEKEGAQSFFSWSSNFRHTCSRNSGEARTTGGNSPSISNGRQASKIAREFAVRPFGRRG